MIPEPERKLRTVHELRFDHAPYPSQARASRSEPHERSDSAEDQGLSAEQAETQLREGVSRWREQDEQRKLQALTTLPLDQLTAEQRELLARRLGAGRAAPKGSPA